MTRHPTGKCVSVRVSRAAGSECHGWDLEQATGGRKTRINAKRRTSRSSICLRRKAEPSLRPSHQMSAGLYSFRKVTELSSKQCLTFIRIVCTSPTEAFSDGGSRRRVCQSQEPSVSVIRDAIYGGQVRSILFRASHGEASSSRRAGMQSQLGSTVARRPA